MSAVGFSAESPRHYLGRERARDAGATAVATFERALLREQGFVAP